MAPWGVKNKLVYGFCWIWVRRKQEKNCRIGGATYLVGP